MLWKVGKARKRSHRGDGMIVEKDRVDIIVITEGIANTAHAPMSEETRAIGCHQEKRGVTERGHDRERDPTEKDHQGRHSLLSLDNTGTDPIATDD